MPGAGKSTIGVVLAKNLGISFIDSDLLIQERTEKQLYELIEEHGFEGFLDIEGAVNADINPKAAVIATGGSAVYRDDAMQHLLEIATVFYLRLPYESVAERLGDLTQRGVVFKAGQSLEQLYKERVPLYEKYANIIIDCEGKNMREIVFEIAKRIKN